MSTAPLLTDISEAWRTGLYEIIARRRDIRAFRPGVPLADDVLLRILGAAHRAPSVGYSQPWDFIVLRDEERRGRIRESFLRCREAEAARFPAERREKYLSYRLEGILESAVNICVTVDLRPANEPVLGTTAQPESLRWSACCAVQNLWLAARAEGVGVGWVSIVEPQVLRSALGLPPGIEPVAYLCVGHPVEFRDRPLLEETGWRSARPVEKAIHLEQYRPEERETAPAGEKKPSGERGGVEGPAVPASDGLPDIPAFDEAAREASRRHQARLTKPEGSLGRLETLAGWYAGARGGFPLPPPSRAELFVFAADHGVVAEGVSAYPSSVTPAMVCNFVSGGAAVNALARACQVALTVVDVGVAGDLSALPRERAVRFVSAPVRAGTRNFRWEPALSVEEASAALRVGIGLASDAAARGVDLLATGEMGIGNTTAATALLCAFTGLAPEEVVGAGTGLDGGGMTRKAQVIRDSLALHAPDPSNPLQVLARVGGLEIAGMAGLMIGGAANRIPVVVDGFISGAAALVATALRPAVRDYLCFAHLSAERGHAAMCRALKAAPLFDLGMRLGEGTGAVLASQLVRASVQLEREMATFATAGIPDRVSLVSSGAARG